MTHNKKGMNQFITEEVLGECWHEWQNKLRGYGGQHQVFPYDCKKCGNKWSRKDINRDFTTPIGWWYLMDFCIKEDWFDDFLVKSYFFKHDKNGNFILVHTLWLRDKKVFPEAMAKFHGWTHELDKT